MPLREEQTPNAEFDQYSSQQPKMVIKPNTKSRECTPELSGGVESGLVEQVTQRYPSKSVVVPVSVALMVSVLLIALDINILGKSHKVIEMYS